MPDASSLSDDRGIVLNLKVVMTPDFDATLDTTAAEWGVSRVEVIRRGFNLIALALKARRDGQRLLLVDADDETECEITI